MNEDALGDRMKRYERVGDQSLIPMLPAIARIDGKCFSRFTRGMARPYDKRLVDLMVNTTAFLVKETNAKIGYTQSDEITLIWEADSYKSEIFFNGRVAKMVSILAATATAYFNSQLCFSIPERKDARPVFDCRVWNVPNRFEASNTLIWRELDATRNSISMAAQSFFSHKQLFKKSCSEMQEMLFSRGINWNDYSDFFKRGTYVQRKPIERPYTEDERQVLPPKHHARFDPNLKILRHDVMAVEMPKFASVVNREQVIFNGASPIVFELSAGFVDLKSSAENACRKS